MPNLRRLSEVEYQEEFGIAPAKTAKRRRALQHALDIRKFEIEQYWKRATYFWTFIAASLAGFAAVHTAREVAHRQRLAVLIGCLGLVFSFSWWCVNRGSKRWQENWENHVDMLEDEFIGPLYKTVAGRPPIDEHEALGRRGVRHAKYFLTGPAMFSVSKVNQLVSLFVTVLWIPMILLGAGPLTIGAPVDLFSVSFVSLAVITCALILWSAKSDEVDFKVVMTQRRTNVVIPKAHAESRRSQRVSSVPTPPEATDD